MDIDHRVAQLLASRICHDLAGGLGAMSAGLELIADGGAEDNDALKLLEASARQTSRRLAFFRVAFGVGGGTDDRVPLEDLGALTADMLEGGRVSLVWPEPSDLPVLPLVAGKVLLNLCLLASEALPRGGLVTVGAVRLDDDFGFAITARGERAGLKPDVLDALSPDMDAEALNARTVHAHFTTILVQSLEGELEIGRDGEDEFRLAAVIPA